MGSRLHGGRPHPKPDHARAKRGTERVADTGDKHPHRVMPLLDDVPGRPQPPAIRAAETNEEPETHLPDNLQQLDRTPRIFLS